MNAVTIFFDQQSATVRHRVLLEYLFAAEEHDAQSVRLGKTTPTQVACQFAEWQHLALAERRYGGLPEVERAWSRQPWRLVPAQTPISDFSARSADAISLSLMPQGCQTVDGCENRIATPLCSLANHQMSPLDSYVGWHEIRFTSSRANNGWPRNRNSAALTDA